MKKISDLTSDDVIHCETEEKANAILKLSKSSIGINYWEYYKENSCYRPITDSYCEMSWYEERDYTIHKASEFLVEEFILPQLWCVKDCKEVSDYATQKWNCFNEVYETSYYHEGISGCRKYGFYTDILDNYTEISLDQFKTYVLKSKNTEMTELPSVWFVKNDGSQLFKDTVIKYLNQNYNKDYDGSVLNGNYGVGNNGKADYWGNPNHFGKEVVELTLEQFIQLTTKEMTKEIIGYRLKESCKQYEDAARKIQDREEFDFEGFATRGAKTFTIAIKDFKKAGVLDLWFDAIYKEDDYKVGEWVIGWHNSNSDNYCNPWRIHKLNDTYAYTENGHNTGISDIKRKATIKEVKNFLVSQAKEKGFTTEVKFTAVRDTFKGDLKANGDKNGSFWDKELAKCGSTFVYDNITDTLLTSGFGLYVIYENGTWATIKPQKEVVTLTCTGGSFDVTVNKDSIDFEGYKIDIEEIKTILNLTASVKSWRVNPTHFDIGCKKAVSRLDLHKVLDVYNKLQK